MRQRAGFDEKILVGNMAPLVGGLQQSQPRRVIAQNNGVLLPASRPGRSRQNCVSSRAVGGLQVREVLPDQHDRRGQGQHPDQPHNAAC